MEVGVRLMTAPTYTHTTLRGTSQIAVGRSGDFFATDNARDPYEMKITIRTRLSNRERVSAWLDGSGLLFFSWQADRACPARIDKDYSWKLVVPGADPLLEAEIVFMCQPWHYLHPQAEAKTITVSGTHIVNPGTLASLPVVTIVGHGEFTINIGQQSLFFQSIEDGIVINSDLGDAYDLDATTLLNNKVTGDLWEIEPGDNIVFWTAEPGSLVESVTILPMWRYGE